MDTQDKTLKDIHFSEIVLTSKIEDSFLKNTKEASSSEINELVSLKDSLLIEAKNLKSAIEKVIDEKIAKLGFCQSSFKFEFNEVTYRVSPFYSVGDSTTYFCRKIPEKVPSINSLDGCKEVRDLLLNPKKKKGLVIFTGAQSSGKTTYAVFFYFFKKMHKFLKEKKHRL